MINWISANTLLLMVMSGVSLFVFAAGLVSFPLIVSRLPEDFFLENREPWYRHFSPLPYMTVLVVKNILGFLLLLLGIVMLFAPGQGLLTITVALAVINFPGKTHLVYKLVSIKRLQRALNWIRRKRGVPEFSFPIK